MLRKNRKTNIKYIRKKKQEVKAKDIVCNKLLKFSKFLVTL